MNVGQKVRVKAASQAVRDWKVPRGAQGTVICKYRLLKQSQMAPVRLDVRFSPQFVLWGAPEEAFEPISDSSSNGSAAS
jgi:hypothetical protein